MPDFGIFRGFNDKLFGDKLVAGQLPINLGMVASDFIDIDALAFFARVTAAGGTLSATEQLAIITLVKQMKTDGIWSKMKAIYPMVGASAAACAQNLKSSSFTGVFNGGWTFASTGTLPNGTNSNFNTNLNWSANTDLDNVSFGAYWRLRINSTNYYGAYDGTSFALVREQQNSDYYINNLALQLGLATLSNGFHCATRLNSTEQVMYVNGVATVSTPVNSVSKPNTNFLFGQGIGRTKSEHQFGYISEGINQTEATNFYNAVESFQTTLSRQA
jgi:hypothetical protein